MTRSRPFPPVGKESPVVALQCRCSDYCAWNPEMKTWVCVGCLSVYEVKKLA